MISKMDYCKSEWQKLQYAHGSQLLLNRSTQLDAEVKRLEAELDRVIVSFVP